MIDLQGKLLELYSGESFELFQRIVPVCTRCDLVAVGTLNCTLCSNALLCSACMASGISTCPGCEKQGGESPYTATSVNKVAEQILESCSFNCPFPECEKQNIPYRDFEYHFKSQCEHRRVFCPIGCGSHLKRNEVQIHLASTCPMQPVNCPQCKEDQWNGKKLLRGTINDHFERCIGFTTCQTCCGVYKRGRNINGQNFDHQCSDYLNRFLKQIAGTQAYETARRQMLEGLEQLHSASQPRFVVAGSLEDIVSEQIKGVDEKLRTLMSQIENDFGRRDDQLNTRLVTAEFFIENQKVTNQYLKPFVQAELTFAKVRKLALVGSDAFTKFQWPSETQLRALTLENLAESKLKALEWHVTGSLWSICMKMSDGRTSGHIGTRNKLDQLAQFDASDTIVQVQLLESRDQKYCQGMRILGRRGNFQQVETLAEAIGADEAGEWQTFDLKPTEVIVGVYGSVNSANNLRGLGFMVWEPLNTKQTQ